MNKYVYFEPKLIDENTYKSAQSEERTHKCN